jgi:hypothetical protein
VPEIPSELRRSEPPRLPELAESDLVRHFTELSTRNFGIDTGFYPLGSCTMKHNPRVNERLAALPGFRDLHTLQDEEGAQGALRICFELQEALAEITGLPAVSLQPAAGSQGELTGLMLMRAYFREQGEEHERRRIVIPDTAHGTNPASVTMAGYEVTPVRTDPRGNIDVDDLRAKVDEGTAGLMLTNPSTLGLFDENIEEITRIFHGAGALMYYDGANLNAVCGISRPGDMGFDTRPSRSRTAEAGPAAVRSRSGNGSSRTFLFPPSSAPARSTGSTTSGPGRSEGCAASTGRSASSSARTPSSGRMGRSCARCRRWRSSTPTTSSHWCGMRTTCRSTGFACTSSCSRRAL